MKHFIKVFLISLVIFSGVIFTGMFTYAKYFNPESNILGEDTNKNPNGKEPLIFDSPLEKAIYESSRVNILLMGLEGTRTDTIMIASYDKETKKANIISVPRDTYYEREGYGKYSEFMKINSVYGTEKERQDAVKKAVEEVTGIPIHNYVSIEYDGVRAAVDAVGGIEFDVPFHMKYTDPYDKPPLYINIPAGNQLITGDKAMELLRFRKGDPGYRGYLEGDVGRIQLQQEFIKAAVKKALSLKLPSVISAVYPHVETDFSLTDLLSLGTSAIGFSTENLQSHILPGYAQYMGGLSFYILDGEEITKLLYELYDVPITIDDDVKDQEVVIEE